jgi:hypothetical protein
MHSLAHVTNGLSASASQPANTWQRFADEARKLLSSKRDYRGQRARLVQDHRDLDDLISVLACGPSIEDGLITRLKKRKLNLRDEIARVDAEIVSREVRAPP